MGIGRGAASVFIVVSAMVALAACNGSGAATVTLPPEGGIPDYQLGEGYPPDEDVRIVVRDRTSPPADDLYSVCYVNAFQTQPDELDTWPEELVLRDDAGEPVFDPDWPDEALLDTSSDDNQESIAEIVGPWIQECAAAGYKAVEFDNLDSYSRSDGALTLDHNAELAEDLVEIAHEAGLAAAQKNAPEDAALLREEAGFDFVIAEECAYYEECEAYEAVYGDHVIDIEYADNAAEAFFQACEEEWMPASAVLRDRQLAAPGEPGYEFATCQEDD